MARLNQLTHPNPLIQVKSNYFANFFEFVSNSIGTLDELEIENYLSIIDNCVYQIQNNIENCSRYLDVYLSHPLITNNKDELRKYRNFIILEPLIASYQAEATPSKKISWIKLNKQFELTLIALRTELRKYMFKKSLRSIISYLKCTHPIEEHVKDLEYLTNILVSEFVHNNRAKNDLSRVFDRIMSSEISRFPYPKTLIQNKDSKNIDEIKKKFLEKRSFQQQFEGIYNILKEKDNKHYFIFRIMGINAQPDFSYKYNKVTFYHPNHSKLKDIKKTCKNQIFTKDFFKRKTMLIAVVKVNYFSNEMAEQKALDLIRNELEYVNQACGANSYIEKYGYLVTTDFKHIRWLRSAYEKGHLISGADIIHLNDTPLKFLKGTNAECRNHFLQYESMYIGAKSSRNMAEYWQYLEALMPLNNGEKQIIGSLPLILLLNAEEHNKLRLNLYISNAIFHSSSSSLGISPERFREICLQIPNLKLDYKTIVKEIQNPFILRLIKRYLRPYSKATFKNLHKYYERIFWELQAQRNALVHSGYGNENAMITLNATVPLLIQRFRRVIFKGMWDNKNLTFGELIDFLKLEANNLKT